MTNPQRCFIHSLLYKHYSLYQNMKIERTRSYQQIRLRYCEQQFHKRIQGIVEGLVTIEAKHSKVDIVTTKSSLQHRETDRYTLQFHRIYLVLGNFHIQYVATCGAQNMKYMTLPLKITGYSNQFSVLHNYVHHSKINTNVMIRN